MSSFAHKPFPQFGKRKEHKRVEKWERSSAPNCCTEEKNTRLCREKNNICLRFLLFSIRGKTGGMPARTNEKNWRTIKHRFPALLLTFLRPPLPPICSINKFSARGGVFICGRRRETQIRSGKKINFLLWVFVGEIPSGDLRWRPRHLFLLFSSLRPPPTLVCQIKIKSPDRRKAGAGGEYFLFPPLPPPPLRRRGKIPPR